MERAMRDILIEMREQSGVVAVKAEFEAEGTRMDELLRLMDVVRAAQLPLAVKIGGCEAIRDLLESKQVGVRYIVAPMIESPYALSKYAHAKNVVFAPDELVDVDFLFNIETITGRHNVDELCQAAIDGGLSGIVFGRSDFAGSIGLPGTAVNSESITEHVLEVSRKAKEYGLDFVMGGGVSTDALPVLRAVREMHLTRFETRKVIFVAGALDLRGVEKGLLHAVQFELMWLANKRDYYGHISKEDVNRIATLESRWGVTAESLI